MDFLRAVTESGLWTCGSRVRDVSTRREARRIGGIVERDLDSRVAVESIEGSSFLPGLACVAKFAGRESYNDVMSPVVSFQK